LSGEGARVIDSLFRSSHATVSFGLVVSLLLSVAGTTAVGRWVQALYEKIFEQDARSGWRNMLRCFVWAVGAALEVVLDAFVSPPLGRLPIGRVFLGFGNLAIVTAFFWWGLRWLLCSRVPWRRLFPAALATGVFWVGLGAFAALYFASALVSDDHLYGAIGAVFTLVSWFVAMGAVIVLGAVIGRVWVARREARLAGQASAGAAS
jgi:membrane protein